MANWEAVQLAIHMAQQPALVRVARRGPLPRGMIELLELASRDAETSSAATETFGIPQDQMHAAVIFFVEQVLFHHRANYYRTLGTEAGATSEELRRHMALLMKWLHPDAGMAASPNIDRSVFINRLTEAWEVLKSQDRRRQYDASISSWRVNERSRSLPRPLRRPAVNKLPQMQPQHDSVLRRIISLWSSRR